MKNASIQLGISLAVLVALLLAYGTWYAYIAHETARAASLQQSIVSQSDATVRAAQAARLLAQLGSREEEIESHFVAVPNVVNFLQDLQAVGAKEGAKVTVGSVSEASSPRSHLDIALTITGSFDAVMRAIGVIEHGPYDIQTTRGALTGSGSADSPSSWSATMTITVGTKKTATSTTTPSFFSGPSAPPSSSPTGASGNSSGSGSGASTGTGVSNGPRPTS